MTTEMIIANTKQMIDDLKTVCTNFGLGNASSEYKIITEIFLYKFLNDKFLYEVKQADKKLKNSENVEQDLNESILYLIYLIIKMMKNLMNYLILLYGIYRI